MPTSTIFTTAVCDRYEDLLKDSQCSWSIWNEMRERLSGSCLRSRIADDELRNLQARYARAYAALENHSRTCSPCRRISQLNNRANTIIEEAGLSQGLRLSA
jgi:thiamine biosynthesis lipoprotein ApbE